MQIMGDEYFNWLIDIVNKSADFDCKNYTDLLQYLFVMDYEWMPEIELDGNRETAGLELRSKYSEELSDSEYYEFVDIFSQIPCSCLEMFIALSIELGSLISVDDDEPSKIFWLMMENLKLTKYKNGGFIVDNVDEIIRDFLERNYDENGENGGPFFIPLFSSFSKDFRSFDLFRQGSVYLGQFFGKI